MIIKEKLTTIAIIGGLFCLVTTLSFKTENKKKNVVEYFINPKLGDLNYRTFQSKNNLNSEIILQQNIKRSNNSQEGIQMKYVFMTKDSTPIYSGIENIESNKIEIIQQSLYINNQKIQANNIKNNIWYPNSEELQPISLEFNIKESGYLIKSDATTSARFKDTLGQKSLIVELKSIMTTSLNGKELSQIESNSKRWYVKNKGLVYYGQVAGGNKSDYFLVVNN